jgi:hypothetical protein
VFQPFGSSLYKRNNSFLIEDNLNDSMATVNLQAKLLILDVTKRDRNIPQGSQKKYFACAKFHQTPANLKHEKNALMNKKDKK